MTRLSLKTETVLLEQRTFQHKAEESVCYGFYRAAFMQAVLAMSEMSVRLFVCLSVCLSNA